SGKTTLLETLLGRREPKKGKLRLGHGVEPAYFSQHEIELDESRTVLSLIALAPLAIILNSWYRNRRAERDYLRAHGGS
ncbi:MAG TPA: hypothetical protein VLZ04_09065, partial [Gaiellaceae bacterium]|nr:hypothetical protein [Gaiellaceae bacterium]